MCTTTMSHGKFLKDDNYNKIKIKALKHCRGKKNLKFPLVPRASTSKFLLVLLPNNLSEKYCRMPMKNRRFGVQYECQSITPMNTTWTYSEHQDK